MCASTALHVRLGHGIISVMHTHRLFHKLRLLGILCVLLAAQAFARDTNWEHELAAWRVQHVNDLLKPAGWLSLTGLEWLHPGDNSFGTAADNKIRLAGNSAGHMGILHLEGNSVKLLPPFGGFPPDLRVADAQAKEQLLPVEADKDRNAPHITIGTLNMYVIRREDRYALRVKDSKSPTLVGFHGLKWYEPDGKYRVNPSRWRHWQGRLMRSLFQEPRNSFWTAKRTGWSRSSKIQRRRSFFSFFATPRALRRRTRPAGFSTPFCLATASTSRASSGWI